MKYLLLSIIVLLVSMPILAQVPSAEDQKVGKALVLEIFQSEIDKAQDRDSKLELINTLLESADSSGDDNIGRYALLMLSYDVSIAAGDVAKLDAVISKLESMYKLDKFKLLSDAIKPLVNNAEKGDESVNAKYVELVHYYISQDDYVNANKMIRDAVSANRMLRTSNKIKEIVQLRRDVASAERKYKKVKSALEKILEDPTDKEANLIAGKYKAFIKGDWELGLMMLKNSSDKELAELAALELTKPTDAQNMMKIGDGWWQVAEAASGLESDNIKSHAIEWYKVAEPSLTGLAKKKVDIRMKSFSKEALKEEAQNEKAIDILLNKKWIVTGPRDKSGKLLIFRKNGTFEIQGIKKTLHWGGKWKVNGNHIEWHYENKDDILKSEIKDILNGNFTTQSKAYGFSRVFTLIK